MPPQSHTQQRRYRHRREWQQILSDYEQSGLTQSVFCQQQGIALSNFHQWRRKLKAEQTGSPRFVELTPQGTIDPSLNLTQDLSNSHWQIELDLGQGRVLRLRTA